MMFLEAGIGLEHALEAFEYGGEVAGALRFGQGHINDTFAVYTQQPKGAARRFILQRINRHVFADTEGLMANVVAVTAFLRKKISDTGLDPDRHALTLVPTKQGGSHFVAPDGGVWRSYLFIENAVCYQRAETPAMFGIMGRAFGDFARMLGDFPARTLHETIYKFHDTRHRLENFERALRADLLARAQSCRKETEFILARAAECGVLMDLLDAGELPLRVSHNDTKLNNILMDPASGQAVCVLDLDTVMPGLSLHDYGDSIRSGANTSREDERDVASVSFSLPLFESYTEGYLAAAGSVMTSLEKQLLPWGAKLMTLELAMRSLTDYLEGDVYFKARTPEQNLDRTRVQLKLVEDMERAWDEMHRIVKKYS